MVLHFDGRYRTTSECKFLEQVEEDLTNFWNTCQRNSVLVFPPLDAHYRFLIHELVGVGSRFRTVSIGQEGQRRTVVYLAAGRELHNMAHSPSTSQRTFFGRGRGRRTRRPDQALYVPGALRQSKHEQQEQSLRTESSSNKVENKESSRNNSVPTECLTNSTCGSTRNGSSDCNKSDQLKYKTKTAESSHHGTPVSNRTGNALVGTDSISSDMHVQQINIQSHFTADERLISEIKDINRENVRGKDIEQKLSAGKESQHEMVATTTDNSSMALVTEEPDTQHIRDERGKRDTENSATEDQSLEKEPDNIENYCRKHTVDEDNTEHSQTCTAYIVSNCWEAEHDLTADNENCEDSNDKLLKEDKCVKEQDHGVTKCMANQGTATPKKESDIENHAFQDGPSLIPNQDAIFGETKTDTEGESKLTKGAEITAGYSSKISVVDHNDGDSGDKVIRDENWTESDINLQGDSVGSGLPEVLVARRGSTYHSDGVDYKEEKADDREITREHVLQPVSSSSRGMTLECTGSACGTEGLSVQPPTTQTGMCHSTFDDLATTGHDSQNQHGNDSLHLGFSEDVVKHGEEATAASDSIGDESRVSDGELLEEPGLRTPQTSFMSTHKSTENSGNDLEVTSDIFQPTCSIDSGELESQDNALSLGNSSESETKLEITGGKTVIEATSDKTVGSSDSAFTELNQTVDDSLQTEQPKASKKKKTKKDKSKEQGDDKVKSKEKGEKKKKKEKKSVKTEKSDMEQIVDSAVKIKEKKKSKTKGLSSKHQSEHDLSCDGENRPKLLPADSKDIKAFCSNECDDSDGDDGDNDNWESNFDESGDCLNPEQLEELSRLTGIASPEVLKTQFDYYSFTPKAVELDEEEFGHIVEIYNFSPELKTQNIMQALSSFRSKGFDIRWVDDTHALGIFSSRISAQEAILMCSSPLMRLRPISEGTAESRRKACNCFEFLQPYKERPQTSKLLADRLVTGALGMRSKMTREERVKEREKIKEAKHKKQQEKIQKAQIWGD